MCKQQVADHQYDSDEKMCEDCLNKDATEKDCEGYCPFCDSESIDYHASRLDNGQIIHPLTCKDCGKWGEEIYNVVYDSTIMLYDEESTS